MNIKLKAITSPPSREELTNRLKNVRKLMEEQNMDYYISFNPVNIYYLTNFAFYVHERPFIHIIERQGIPKMLIPRLEKGHFESRALCELEFVIYYEFPARNGENWYNYYQKQIRADATVGLESELPIGIANKTPGKKVISDIIDEIRILKTDYEIGRTYHACRVVNKGHKILLKKCRPKVLEFALY